MTAPLTGIIIGGPKDGQAVPLPWTDNEMAQATDGGGDGVHYRRRVYSHPNVAGGTPVVYFVLDGMDVNEEGRRVQRHLLEVGRACAEANAPQLPVPAAAKPARRIDPAQLSDAVDECLALARAHKEMQAGMNQDQLQDYVATRAVAWAMVLAGRFGGVGQFTHALSASPRGVAITVTRAKAPR